MSRDGISQGAVLARQAGKMTGLSTAAVEPFQQLVTATAFAEDALVDFGEAVLVVSDRQQSKRAMRRLAGRTAVAAGRASRLVERPKYGWVGDEYDVAWSNEFEKHLHSRKWARRMRRWRNYYNRGL